VRRWSLGACPAGARRRRSTRHPPPGDCARRPRSRLTGDRSRPRIPPRYAGVRGTREATEAALTAHYGEVLSSACALSVEE
jgi:hypothetical protein